ncbi:MAG: hypothetical protein RLY87_675 [Chloroflexota bacterium]|jgi:AcrR family transcriptional regulator
MPRPKKTAVQIEQMRARILDCATAILNESGPDAISSRSIAERLGIAHMTLYTYFANQGEILQSLIDREWIRVRSDLQEFEGDMSPDTVITVIHRVLHYISDYGTQNPNMYKLTWVSNHTSFESREQNIDRLRALVNQFAQVLSYGIDCGILYQRDPFIAAITTLTMMNAPFFLYYSGKMGDMYMCNIVEGELYQNALMYLIKPEFLAKQNMVR